MHQQLIRYNCQQEMNDCSVSLVILGNVSHGAFLDSILSSLQMKSKNLNGFSFVQCRKCY